MESERQPESKEPPLGCAAEDVGVETGFANAVRERLGTVRAINSAGRHTANGVQQLVVVGMIGNGDRVVDPELETSAAVDRPTGDRNANLASQPLDPRRARRNDQHVPRFRAAFPLAAIPEMDSKRLVNPADGVDRAVLEHGKTGVRKQPGYPCALPSA